MFGNGSSPRRDYTKDNRSDSRQSPGDSSRKESPNSFPSIDDSPHLTPSQRFAGTSTFALPSPPLPSLPSNRSISSIDRTLNDMRSSGIQQRSSHPAVPRSFSQNSLSSPVSPALPDPPRDSDASALNSPVEVVVLNADRARRSHSSDRDMLGAGDVAVQAKDAEGKYRNVLKSTRRPSPALKPDEDFPSTRLLTAQATQERDLADLTIDPNRRSTAGGQPSTPPPAIARRRIHQDALDPSMISPSYIQQQQFRQKSNSFSSPMQRPIPDSPAFYASGKEMSNDHLAEMAAGNLGNSVGFSGGMGNGEDWKSVLSGYQHQRSTASSAPPLLSSPLAKQPYSRIAGDVSLALGGELLPHSLDSEMIGGGRASEDADVGFGRVSHESDRSRKLSSGLSAIRRDGSPVRRDGSPLRRNGSSEEFSQRDPPVLSSPLALHARPAASHQFVPSHPLPTTPAPEPLSPPLVPAPSVSSPAMLIVEAARNNGLLPTPPNSDYSHSPDLNKTADVAPPLVTSLPPIPDVLKPGPITREMELVDALDLPSITPRMSLEEPQPPAQRSQPRLSIDTFQPSSLPPPPPVVAEARPAQETPRPARGAPPSRTASIIPRIEIPSAQLEFALSIYPETILVSLLRFISLQTVQSLRKVSKTLARCLEVDAKEFILQRFLGAYGYRSYATGEAAYSPTTIRRKDASSSSAEAREVVITSRVKDMIVLDLRDVDAFFIGLRYSIDEFHKFAQAHSNPHSPPLSVNTICMIRASTRAWNRVVLRIRAQSIGGDDGDVLARLRMRYEFEGMGLERGQAPIYKVGRAPVLRVWVPTKGNSTWLSDEELVECEREVWRSGTWSSMNRGDVVWNIALGDFANNGKLISDGKYLRDLDFAFDVVGHLPSWLDMLSFSPSTYHNLITSSANPVFYLSLSTFIGQIRETLTLCQDKIAIASPQGEYIVKRFVYRSSIKLRSGTICGSEGGKGFGPGGVEVVHDDWVGFLILETDGTTEHATSLIARCSNPQATPYRILREKSRPGKIWLTPVAESERIN